jgi:hypothetical protein
MQEMTGLTRHPVCGKSAGSIENQLIIHWIRCPNDPITALLPIMNIYHYPN